MSDEMPMSTNDHLVAMVKTHQALRQRMIDEGYLSEGPPLLPSRGEVWEDRWMVTVTAFRAEGYEESPGMGEPIAVGKFIRWLSGVTEAIPTEYRESAKIEIRSEGGYEGDHSAIVKITYERPESDDEMARRLEQKAKRDRAQQAKDLAQLSALKNKYGL